MAIAADHVTPSTPGDWDEPVGLLRAVVRGALLGAVLAFIGTTAGMLAADVEVGSAVGLGLFVAMWGGLGFGSMVGGVVWVSNHEDHHDGDGGAAELSPTPESHPAPDRSPLHLSRAVGGRRIV